MSSPDPSIVVFGVFYPNLDAAAEANKVSPALLASHMRKCRETAEAVIASLQEPGISVFGKTYLTVKAAMEAYEAKYGR